MYSDIGKKIKRLSEIFFWIEFVLAELWALRVVMLGAQEEEVLMIVAGISCIIISPIVFYIGNMAFYGLGELIDKVSDIERHTRISRDAY